jgi:hypothetical protein
VGVPFLKVTWGIEARGGGVRKILDFTKLEIVKFSDAQKEFLRWRTSTRPCGIYCKQLSEYRVKTVEYDMK